MLKSQVLQNMSAALMAADNRNQALLESTMETMLRYTEIDRKTWMSYCGYLWDRLNHVD